LFSARAGAHESVGIFSAPDFGLIFGVEPGRRVGILQLLAPALLLIGGVAVLHFSCLRLASKRRHRSLDLADFYPLSVFKFRPPHDRDSGPL